LGVVEVVFGKDYFDELVVMVDIFRFLEMGEGVVVSDDGVYVWSWFGGCKGLLEGGC